jgi:hypothetical protein
VHGEVTIIRPPAPDPAPASDGGRVEAPVLIDRDAIARQEAVRVEIARLQRQAAVLKKAEAAKAVRWIRRAIAEHGLTAEDLGL